MRFFKAIGSAGAWLVLWYASQYAFVYAGVGIVNGLQSLGVLTISPSAAVVLNAIIPLAANVMIIPIAAAVYAVRRKPPLASMGVTSCRIRELVIAVALGFFACLTVLLLMMYIPFPESWRTAYDESAQEVLDWGNPVFSVIASVIVAPIVEEVVFRGLIYGKLRNGMPAVLAAVLSAAVFGAAHGQAIWMVYTFLLGLLFAYVYERTKSIVPGMLLHMSFNIFGQITIFPQNAPPLLVFAVYTAAPYVVGWLVWYLTRITKREESAPQAEEPI